MDLPDDLRPLVELQCGLVSRAQLTTAGVSAAAVRWRLGRTWRMVLPGVVATFTGNLDPRQRLIAAQLYGGPGSMLGSWTAAAWHGVEAARASQVRMIVPICRSARRAGFVVVSRTTRPDPQSWSRPPLTLTSRARSVIDAARDVNTQRRADSIVIEAVQRRLVTVEALRHEVECGPRQGSKQARVALAAAESDVWSVAELDLTKVIAGSRILRDAWPNPELSLPTGQPLPSPDLWLDDVGLAVQVHSRNYHARDQDWEGTVMADSALGEAGVVVIGATPSRIARDPIEVRTQIERSYLSLKGRPRPNVIARPRSKY